MNSETRRVHLRPQRHSLCDPAVGVVIFAAASLLKDTVNRIGDLVDDGLPNSSFKSRSARSHCERLQFTFLRETPERAIRSGSGLPVVMSPAALAKEVAKIGGRGRSTAACGQLIKSPRSAEENVKSSSCPLCERAPSLPGFLTVTEGENPLLQAAVHFADTREADLSACAPTETEPLANTATLELHTAPDPFARIWVLFLLAALLIA